LGELVALGVVASLEVVVPEHADRATENASIAIGRTLLRSRIVPEATARAPGCVNL
jgi:hypothetical protein